MATTSPRPPRLRAAAVAVVLLVGAGAAVATSPPVQDCPDPPSAGEVGEFYGPQEHDSWTDRTATPAAFVGGGYDVVDVGVRAPGCLTADDVDVPVHVDLRIGGVGTEPVPDDVLRTLTVSDGRGRTWLPAEVTARGWVPPRSEGARPVEGYAGVTFLLPVDLTSPVSLHLGDLSSATLDRLSLDAPDAPAATP
ncbi:hypothetical protein J1G42_05465 [Cellulomonas sp. zg-ZUI222]|uniref:DUF4352 domain-containing protein n=1 Tax=Cellulomonas wangleii TaxID=2816956 RepID=A0ABX8D2F9_9CELL|nr:MULTISPECIES: hypothetical protein [Cellulomonas]MBO0899419.1 hypothetical protein [Cellulomonas sp. zg-ZUI22]MBO0920270.1 hypothetical protein [Cellulomonas wangleii]MBO0923298.1 hypothetical protein [Cellulomonas wangleii]QVI61657.1 hypothetical protein KG103_14505 [Cellulomonas wangleii]